LQTFPRPRSRAAAACIGSRSVSINPRSSEGKLNFCPKQAFGPIFPGLSALPPAWRIVRIRREADARSGKGLEKASGFNDETGSLTMKSTANGRGSQYWFPAKRYGWGWGPPTMWQGWVVLIVWFAAIAIAALLLMPAQVVA